MCMEISLCMIVRNEEKVLDNCLRSVCDLVDEIIIVDTGSTDRTKELAARYTDRIYDFEWIDDFSAARNYSFSKATKDYIMWLDADDILTAESREALAGLKSNLSTDIEVVYMPYHYSFTEDGRVTQAFNRERIVKRSAGFVWEDEIHETIVCPEARSIISDIVITHTAVHKGSDRNFLILKKLIQNGKASPKMLFYYAGELAVRQRSDEAIGYFNEFFEKGGRESSYCLKACCTLHELYLAKKQYDKALEVSMACLPFCGDRSEFCCQLGSFYAREMNDPGRAVYWLDLAVKCPRPANTGFVVQEEYYYYVPNIQLGNVLCKLNRYGEALECFREALKYHENDRELQNIVNKMTALIN